MSELVSCGRKNYTYLYRARVIAYPEGSHEVRQAPWGDCQIPVPGWKPDGWEPTDEYIEKFGTTRFIWPVAGRHFKNRASVKRRVELLESYGATAVLERSSRIVWPDPEEAA